LARLGDLFAAPSPRLGKTVCRRGRAPAKMQDRTTRDPVAFTSCRVQVVPLAGPIAPQLMPKMTIVPASARRPPREAFAIVVDTFS
jgi:hypothetical protein